MKTFAQKLKEHREDFASQTRGYSSPAMPEVLAYLKQYKAEYPDKYVYNADLVQYILTKEVVHQDLVDALDTEVYLAQQEFRKEREAEHDRDALAQGYLKLTPDIAYRGEVKLLAKREQDWLVQKVDEVGKIITDARGAAFFIPKGRRTRGYSLFNLKGYYQPITK